MVALFLLKSAIVLPRLPVRRNFLVRRRFIEGGSEAWIAWHKKYEGESLSSMQSIAISNQKLIVFHTSFL